MKTSVDFETHLRAQNLADRTVTSYLWTVAYFSDHYDGVTKANLLAYAYTVSCGQRNRPS